MINKTFSYIILFLIGTYPYLKVSGSNCKTLSLQQARTINYEQSDIVFLGSYINANKEIGTFEIKNLFKGEYNKREIKIDISHFPTRNLNQNTLFLIYGYLNKDIFAIDDCSISRSMSNPVIPTLYSPPPPPDTTQNEVQMLAAIDALQLKAKIEFIEEVLLLKNKKQKENISKVSEKKSKGNSNTLFFIAIIVLFIWNIYLHIRVSKK